MSAKETLGFIGLGVMGRPMAANLLRAGYPLVVHNRSREPVQALAEEGARPAASPAEVARRAGTVILMLPDSPDVEAVVRDGEGLLQEAGSETIVLDMSTISPVVTQELAAALGARGGRWVDGPVSGGDQGAREGTLSIMVGASVGDFQRVRPILEVLGRTIVHMGPVGAGQTMKAVNQIVVGGVFQALAEGLTVAQRRGLDLARVIEVLQGGLAHTRCLELRRENYLSGRFEPGFRIELHRKDLGIALETAAREGVPLPVTGLVHQLMTAMVARGGGGLDHSGLISLTRELSGA